MKFSVVIPVHNKAEYLERSVGSVLKQTHTELELILVDDGSTDDSLTVMRRFTDPRVRIIGWEPPARGAGAARNAGIRAAASKWIALLDADDEWTHDHLHNMALFIAQNPGLRAISCGRRWKKDGQEVQTDPYYRGLSTPSAHTISLSRYLELCLANRRPVNSNSIVFRNDLIQDARFFPEDKTAGEDLVAWIRLIVSAGELGWSPHLGSIAHRTSDNMFSHHGIRRLEIWHDLVQELRDTVSSKELRLMMRYANRQIWDSWMRNYRLGVRSARPVATSLYWQGDVLYCSRSLTYPLVPRALFGWLRQVKGTLSRGNSAVRS